MKHKNIKLIITLLIFIITISIIFNTNKKSSKITDSSTKFEKIPIANKTVTVQWNENSPKVTIQNNYIANFILDVDNNCYNINLTVNVINDSNDTWNEIYFRDYPSAFSDKENGKVSEITNLHDTQTNTSLELIKNEDPTVFSVKLASPLLPNELTSISFDYKAYVPNLNARYGYQTIYNNCKDFYLANCIPILCPYENGNFQYYPYFSVGECFYSKMANYDVTVTIPKSYTLIATGDNTEITNINDNLIKYKYTANAVRDFVIVAGENYEIFSKDVDNIKINCYFHKGETEKANEALKLATETFTKMNTRLGKYPYKQFSIVECEMEMLGMEYPQVILISTSAEGVGSSVHEIIHQWFYNIIGNNQYTNAWIDESITTYLTNPGLDQYTGIITQPYNEFENDSDYSTAMYFYGASFYNKLEEKYGTSKINNFMNELLENYAYKEISTPELVKLLQKYYGTNNSIIKKYIEEKYL